MADNKKVFDPTVSFSFFGTWLNTIEKLETPQDMNSNAYRLFRAIAEYSMYDIEPDFSDNMYLDAIWPLIEREADLSIGKRKSQFAKDEIDTDVQKVIDVFVKYGEISLRKVEQLTGVDKNRVDRIKKTYRQEIENAIQSKVIDADSAIASDIASDYASGIDYANDTVNDYDNYNDYDNDRTGQDRDRTTGQSEMMSCSNPVEQEISEEDKEKVTLLDRMLTRINSVDINNIEIDNTSDSANRARTKWNNLYKLWLKSIENKTVRRIIDMYLATNEEPPTLKRFGDKYGSIVDGWNEETQEPNIVYSLTGYFPNWTRHDIDGIPFDYYTIDYDEVNDIMRERELLESMNPYHVEDEDYTDDMPF